MSSLCLGPCLHFLLLVGRMAHKQIRSDKYFYGHHEYQHVMLPRELSKQVQNSSDV